MAGPGETGRPAVIVSNDRANATAARLGRGVVTVVPVTSGTVPQPVMARVDEALRLHLDL